MKFINIAIVFFLVCLLTTFALPDEEAPKRPNLLLRRPNPRGGPLAGKTSTTTAAPPLEEELGDEEYEIEEGEEVEGESDAAPAPSTTTTTTEPPKKIGPIIRPFRSNDDLLLALKRRQMSMKKGSSKVVEKPKPKETEVDDEEDAAPPAPAKSRPAVGGRKFGGAGHRAADDSPSASGDEGSAPARRAGARFSSRAARSNN